MRVGQASRSRGAVHRRCQRHHRQPGAQGVHTGPAAFQVGDGQGGRQGRRSPAGAAAPAPGRAAAGRAGRRCGPRGAARRAAGPGSARAARSAAGTAASPSRTPRARPRRPAAAPPTPAGPRDRRPGVPGRPPGARDDLGAAAEAAAAMLGHSLGSSAGQGRSGPWKASESPTTQQVRHRCCTHRRQRGWSSRRATTAHGCCPARRSRPGRLRQVEQPAHHPGDHAAVRDEQHGALLGSERTRGPAPRRPAATGRHVDPGLPAGGVNRGSDRHSAIAPGSSAPISAMVRPCQSPRWVSRSRLSTDSGSRRPRPPRSRCRGRGSGPR